jgi:hypothetical protein
MNFDFNLVGVWLDLTSQEFEILKTIYRLELSGKRASPTEINTLYSQENKRTIQKQNLHHILRDLLEAGFVDRKSQGDYRANLPGIRKTLEAKKAAKEAELSGFKRIIENTEGEFKRQLAPSDAPHLEYISADKLYSHMAGNLNKAVEFSIVANFPSIAYPPNLAAKIGRSEYSSALAERCLSKGALKVNIITDLDVDSLFSHCLRAFESPDRAYKLAENVMNALENLMESTKTLDVRYHPDPHGLDVAIPVTDEPREFYLFSRDEHQEIAGAIYIRGKESGRNAIHSFRRSFETADKDLSKHIQEAREKMRHKYGMLGR